MSKERIEYLTNKMYYGYLDGDETKEYIEYINELLNENQQLKEELQKADSITQSCIFEGKEESKINFRKAINLIDKYKSVLNEIRECTKELYEIGVEWHWDNSAMEDYVKEILQILDKEDE